MFQRLTISNVEFVYSQSCLWKQQRLSIHCFDGMATGGIYPNRDFTYFARASLCPFHHLNALAILACFRPQVGDFSSLSFGLLRHAVCRFRNGDGFPIKITFSKFEFAKSALCAGRI